ncbi:MAG: 23S rRNA (uridine(2552)-2'-O)-methyltransferase [Methanobrevibacter sp.]|nr:23S rRNA (uridine(2552)-2'-O)-methyltransferase [Methanobrevibacter sp.]
MGSRWQMEKHKDPYYKKAKQEDYRSRASYKLKQLDKKFKIIKQGNTVVDLGAAPGGWSQVALEKVGEEGVVVGVDLNRFKKFHEENYYGIRGDFTTPEVQEKIMELIGGKAKVVMSDASPSLCGIKNIDQLRSIDLTNAVIGIAENILEPKGNLVMKVFQGPEYKTMLDSLKGKFRQVKTTKPASSRKKSSEMYVVGLGYKHKKNRKEKKN